METEITDHCQLFGSVALAAFIVPYFLIMKKSPFLFSLLPTFSPLFLPPL